MGNTLLSDEEKDEALKLAEQYDWPISKIAKELKRHPETISHFLAGFRSTEKAAKRYLEVQALDAAKAWGKALHVAAADGNHKPARDLLTALDVIKPLATGGIGTGKLIVIVGVGREAACTVPSQAIVDAEVARLEGVIEDRMVECQDLRAFDD